MKNKWLSIGIVALSLGFSGTLVAAKEITFELVNDTKEPVSFALAKVGESPDSMLSALQEIAGKGKVLDKISEDQRQILVEFGSERQLYVISEKPGKHFKLKFGPKRPFSKEMVLAAQVLAVSNISTKDIVMTKKQEKGRAWEDVKIEEKPADAKEKEPPKDGDKKDDSQSDDEKKNDTEKAADEKDDQKADKPAVTAYQVLGVTSNDEATKERQILGFGTSLGKLTFDSAMTTKLSAKDAQKKISEACEKLLELWSGDGLSKKERERIMKVKKVPEDQMDEVATDAHGLIEKTCESVKKKFPTKDGGDDDWWS